MYGKRQTEMENRYEVRIQAVPRSNDTLLRCSEDGEQIFSTKINGAEGKFLNVEAEWLDALTLLSLGFGKNQQ